MAKRRRTGVRKSPSGSWSVDYRDPLGIKRRKTFSLEGKAIEFRERVRTKIRDGEYIVPVKWTVSQGADMFLEKKAKQRSQTFAYYRNHVENFIKPALGHFKMSEVTFKDVELAGKEWSKRVVRAIPIAPGTINKIYDTLASIFKDMKREGIKNNPIKDVERMKKPAAEVAEDPKTGNLKPIRIEEVYSAEELARLIEESEAGRDRALHMTAVFTGMRHGELNGLQWPRVKFKEAIIEVRRSLTQMPKKAGGSILEPPKTRAGYRDIEIPPELVSELRRWRLACPPSELDLVFPNILGGPANRQANDINLKRAMERAKIQVLSMHNLRHSFASQHMIAGTSVTQIAQMMGHRNTDITLKVYAHWAKREKSQAPAVLAGRIFGGVKVAKSRHEGQ